MRRLRYWHDKIETAGDSQDRINAVAGYLTSTYHHVEGCAACREVADRLSKKLAETVPILDEMNLH